MIQELAHSKIIVIDVALLIRQEKRNALKEFKTTKNNKSYILSSLVRAFKR